MIKRLSLGLLMLVLVLIAALGLNTWRKGSLQTQETAVKPVAVDAAGAAQRLAGSVKFRTVAIEGDASVNQAEFHKLHAYLVQAFPKVHAALQREVVGNSLIYTWQGRDPKALPVALLAHQDVVPIASGTEKVWSVDPFGGVIKDGFVWGRGTLDDKGNLVAQLEAVELLLTSSFQPRQTIYFVFGEDEEIGGARGNETIAALLKSRGVKLDFVLDEGMVITEGVFPGLKQPLASIGLAEKGGVNIRLTYDGKPGHSALPTTPSALGSMAQALVRLEQNQMPATIKTGVAADMFGTLAPEMPLLNRTLLSNLWLTEPAVIGQLQKTAAPNAMLRTTTALTIVNGGNKANVLPGHAHANVNYRILPGDTVASVHEHVKAVVANDAIKIEALDGREPSPISPTTSTGYQAIVRTVRQVFSGVLVAPGLVITGTDSRHYSALTDNIYRFSPMRFRPEDLSRLHGTDERIAIDNYVEVIQFYHQLLNNI